MAKASRNRINNASNNFQGNFKKVLCVCSAGVLRSPTLAEVLSRDPFNFNTRAVGTDQEFALVPIDLVHIFWTDEIVVMDSYQLEAVHRLQDEAEELSDGMIFFERRPVHNFDIPDAFNFRDPKLVQALTTEALRVFKNG